MGFLRRLCLETARPLFPCHQSRSALAVCRSIRLPPLPPEACSPLGLQIGSDRKCRSRSPRGAPRILAHHPWPRISDIIPSHVSRSFLSSNAESFPPLNDPQTQIKAAASGLKSALKAEAVERADPEANHKASTARAQHHRRFTVTNTHTTSPPSALRPLFSPSLSSPLASPTPARLRPSSSCRAPRLVPC